MSDQQSMTGHYSRSRMKLLETETIFAFMDIGPIAKGHCLVIPKCESSVRCDVSQSPQSQDGGCRMSINQDQLYCTGRGYDIAHLCCASDARLELTCRPRREAHRPSR